MKKLNLLLYFIFFIVYEELVFSCLIYKTFPASIILIILFSIPIAIIFNLISNIFKPKLNKIITYLITLVIIILFGAQIVYYSIYESILSFYSILNGGQITEFMDVVVSMILKNWYGILLCLLPLIVLIILHAKKVIDFERQNFKATSIKICVLVLAQMLALLYINFVNTNDIYSNKNLYYNTHAPKLMAQRMGFLTAMRIDFQRFAFGFKEKLPESTPEVSVEEPVEDEYNVTDIDFDTMIENEKDETIIDIHKYFASQKPTKKNKYTGMFKGKNLIVFVGESFSSLAIRKDVTPNFYKLYKEGFQFDNFYTPIFPVSTADGEYMTDTSLIPKEGVWSFKEVDGNYMPYSYANIFEGLGYSSNAYHNHTAGFYDRDKYINTMGYNSYLAVGNGLEKRMNTSLWPNSDDEMIDVTVGDYINNDKFVAYYMTVSGHLAYNRIGNCMVYRNWNAVKDLPYSEHARAYLAANIEFDKAIGRLLTKLEENGKLEDTVIVISGDHFPYGLTLDEINELSTYKRDDKFEKYHMPLLIWSGSMKEPVKVDKLGTSLDVLPTVLNLFGVEYDSRLLIGKDILSDSEPLVIFADRSFITDKGKYNAITQEFIPNEGVEVDQDYISKINDKIYRKFQMSRFVLEKDYYRKLFNK